MDDDMREVIEEFLVESFENLDRMDREFVALEQRPDDREVLASVFRTVHTIKGTSGFLGLEKLERLTHVGENLLSRLRDGEIRLTSARTDALLAMVDAVRAMLAEVEANGSDGAHDYSDVVATLERANGDDDATVASVPNEPVPNAAGSAGSATLEFFGPPPAAHSPDVAPAQTAVAAPPVPPTANVADSSIRVDVSLLDGLVNLVGELVLARNQLMRHSASGEDPSLSAATQQLDMITSELQEGVMRTRMQPIGNVWAKFPRVVRDLAAQMGKQVRLELDGKDTELDKTVLEAIKDPLTHIVRNSVDHGIEDPATREAAGKPAAGVLKLRAFHEGGLVNIVIEDDGKGLDPVAIRAKALDRGLITAERAASMNDREAVELVFRPGFSTAETVSNISGRGVGMDVVRTNIERIGGTVDLESRFGHGTVVRIKIPLTLAIIPALIVTTGGERFAIPQVSLLELTRVGGEESQTPIEYVHDAPVYRLRGRLLPIVSLAEELGIEARNDHSGVVNVVVLQADGREFGLVVDEINDTAEIVVKPLGQHFKAVDLFAGATIMGDGQVALIVDVLGIARRRGVVDERREEPAPAAETEAAQHQGIDRESVLVVDTGVGRAAIALDVVQRLEEIAPQRVERTGDRLVVQYRDRIMPLVDLAMFIDPRNAPDRRDQKLHVVVTELSGQPIGVIVGTVFDIVEEALNTEAVGQRRGVVGTAVVQGVVTDVVDLDVVVADFAPSTSGLG